MTKPEDRIFVWGDGPAIYYFSGRRMGARNLWPKTSVIRINSLYEDGTEESRSAAEKNERNFVDVIDKKRPVLFIDTSENDFSTFTFKVTPLVAEYVKEHCNFVKVLNRIKIYRRKNV